AAASRRSLQACIASLPLQSSWMSKTYLKSDHFNGGGSLRPRTRRIFCQPCLDWSERRYHLKGLVGARILDRLLELGWLKRVSNSRALQLTSSGRAGLSEMFQIEINNEGPTAGRLPDLRRLTA